jgi:glutamate synthase (NADPH) large chain
VVGGSVTEVRTDSNSERRRGTHTTDETMGLTDPNFEHESCGVAFVASIAHECSHAIVEAGVAALISLGHRGATGADPETGDGAGALVQVPHEFFQRSVGCALGDPGSYGVGVAFLPDDAGPRARCEELVEGAVRDEGLRFLTWRDVPIDETRIGETARRERPVIRQFFVGGVGLEEQLFERRLYVLRRSIEGAARGLGLRRNRFHIASLSCRTCVYKGMLTATQLPAFYPDLGERDLVSGFCLVHARFSTNVLPRWDLAQPLRMVAHNGEINTLRGNANWMRARQSKWRSPVFGKDIAKLVPVLDESGSDSSQFDNALELLTMGGRSIEHAIMMMIPEAWHADPLMDEDRRAFYEFHSSLLEPWDGPAAMAFTDGRVVGATLDRNGLRPARYCVTEAGWVVMASEAGVLALPEESIVRKGRLLPGELLLVDTVGGRILDDDAVKRRLSTAHPYAEWIRNESVRLDELPAVETPAPLDEETLRLRQLTFGWTEEELRVILAPMANSGDDAIGSMGTDTPLAVMSRRPMLLYNYFKQLFAQVTNPPIDSTREESVMSLVASLGAGGNLLEQGPTQAQRLVMPHPILTAADLEKIRHVTQHRFPTATLPMLFDADGSRGALQRGIEQLCRAASERVAAGTAILVLSDRGADADHAPIPALLATTAVHHHLVREQTRTSIGLVVESGEVREVHHFAALIGFGAEAVHPYLALESIAELERRGLLRPGLTVSGAELAYVAAACKGLLKTIAKMGISTVESYCGAQIFEALGISHAVIERYFPGTPSRIGGIGLEEIAAEALHRHRDAYPVEGPPARELDTGGEYEWRVDGPRHLWNPETIGALQHAVKTGEEASFRRYVARADAETADCGALRGLLGILTSGEPVALEQVEPASMIVTRFATGAMSYGSISKEMHETLAIAMNRLGARSNTGEGGEDPERYVRDDHGDSRRSAIKQVASGRFGVTAHYLVNADELQIKIAQGAKPGEGGQLPGNKVDATIAKLRHSTPGVGLISPPPHHDIYSIEDLAQLIYDLRAINPRARVSVKLTAEVGVGAVAAGVAKAGADLIVVSGYEGGTGASPLTALKHAGVPWELGLAEAHQSLVANGLRDRVLLQTDGQMKTGRDVVVAALLGADEYAFSTAPLVAAGCVLMRVCHLNTCPVGIATQDERLRRRFTGAPEQIERFMTWLAEDVRRHLAAMGARRVADVVGRTELLDVVRGVDHWKARHLDLRPLLQQRTGPELTKRSSSPRTEDRTLGVRLAETARDSVVARERLVFRDTICNADRAVGAALSGDVVRAHGPGGLAADTIDVTLEGSAGQSFGAWLAPGITLRLNGEANDYVGKGLCGGRIIIAPPSRSKLRAEDNAIIGNVALYGATSGEAFIRGVAGERFCVRNSGATCVVEGVGDHGCEYMTGGVAVVLGQIGRNFAAGMSGGIAYLLDGVELTTRVNTAMVELEDPSDDDVGALHQLLTVHYSLTSSAVAASLLATWPTSSARFVVVVPTEYRRALERSRTVGELVSGGRL